MDSLTREKEARLAAERLQASLTDELGKAQRDHLSASQKVIEFTKDLIWIYWTSFLFVLIFYYYCKTTLWNLCYLEMLNSADNIP